MICIIIDHREWSPVTASIVWDLAAAASSSDMAIRERKVAGNFLWHLSSSRPSALAVENPCVGRVMGPVAPSCRTAAHWFEDSEERPPEKRDAGM